MLSQIFIQVPSGLLVDGLKPHVGRTVHIGSKTVLINDLPAVRVGGGDSIVEPTPPITYNTIIAGAFNVLIGR